MEWPLAVAIICGGVIALLLLAYQRFSLATSASASAPSSRVVMAARELIDPILRNRHGITSGEVPKWTLSDVAEHQEPDDLFVIVNGKVYDITDFVDEHPGGVEALMKRSEANGHDITTQFNGPQHPVKVHDVIGEYYIGDLVTS